MRNLSLEVYDIPTDDLKFYQEEVEALEVQVQTTIDRQKVKEQNYIDIQHEPSACKFHQVGQKTVMPLLEKKKDGTCQITGAHFTAMCFLLENPRISIDMVPSDISQEDMMVLIESFDL